MSECIKCHRDATMAIPGDLCDMHWTLWFWWEDGTGSGRKLTQDKAFEAAWESLEDNWVGGARPSDWAEIFREVEFEIYGQSPRPMNSVFGAPVFSNERLQGEVSRLRGVIRDLIAEGSEEECELCWAKKDTLRKGLYPGDMGARESQEGS